MESRNLKTCSRMLHFLLSNFWNYSKQIQKRIRFCSYFKRVGFKLIVEADAFSFSFFSILSILDLVMKATGSSDVVTKCFSTAEWFSTLIAGFVPCKGLKIIRSPTWNGSLAFLVHELIKKLTNLLLLLLQYGKSGQKLLENIILHITGDVTVA